MVDLQALKNIIDDSGITMVAIAQKTGIGRVTLYNRFNGIGEFTASEIQSLSDVLHLSNSERNRVFFAQTVEQE